ncbi:MAG: hypothetical protein FJX54_12395 [Alphaproteobacteria bacterium]|nr:hypothetical protein [Alphaproteobacteria bacterium]
MNPWRLLGWGTAAFLLLLPLVAMQFTDEVDWDAFDFVFMGILFGGVGLGFELVFRRSGDRTYRLAVSLALVTGFLMIWINAAVGIVGDEDEFSVPFVLVVVVALLGAFLARFRPAGMARAMIAASLTQLAVPAAEFALLPQARALVLSADAMILIAFFTALWLAAALLFRRAAR